MKTRLTWTQIVLALLAGVLSAIPECIVMYCTYKATGNSYLAVAALIVTGLINRPAKQ